MSWKSFVIGGLAVGGVALASYVTYRWYKSRKGTEKNLTTATCVKEDAKDQEMPSGSKELENSSKEAQNESNSEIKEWLARLPDPRKPRLSWAPRVLRNLKSMKEFEDTLEALAAYLLGQPRSEEELLEVQQEFGCWWHLVVAYHARVSKELPNFEKILSEDDDILPLTDENGMQLVD